MNTASDSKKIYSYDGPVLVFGTLVSNRWIGQTIASSEAQARNNLAYQFKRSANRIAQSKVTLPGKITIERR